MSKNAQRFNKKQKQQHGVNTSNDLQFTPHKTFHEKDLKRISPITENQSKLFHDYCSSDEVNFLLCGSAGTGKTFSALYLSLRDLLATDSDYEKIIIVRSVVPTRDIGFLPGKMEDKISVYETPYRDICDELFPFKKSYDNLKAQGKIEFMPTSFIRGTTFNNALIIVDEIQNMNWQEIYSVITRVGKGSRILLCGDNQQNDLINKKSEQSGFNILFNLCSNMQNYFHIVQFQHKDIVRSNFIKQVIMTTDKLNIKPC